MNTHSCLILAASCACFSGCQTFRVPQPFDPSKGFMEMARFREAGAMENVITSPTVVVGGSKLYDYHNRKDLIVDGVKIPKAISFKFRSDGHTYLVDCYQPEMFLRACNMYSREGWEVASFLDLQSSFYRSWDQPGVITVGEKNYVVYGLRYRSDEQVFGDAMGRSFGAPPLAAIDCRSSRQIKGPRRYWEAPGLDKVTTAALRAFSAFLTIRQCDLTQTSEKEHFPRFSGIR